MILLKFSLSTLIILNVTFFNDKSYYFEMILNMKKQVILSSSNSLSKTCIQ